MRAQLHHDGQRCGPGGFDESGAQPGITRPDVATAALARALVVAWTHARPGSQVRPGRKTADVRADLGQDGLRHARSDARNRVQALEQLLRWTQLFLDLDGQTL